MFAKDLNKWRGHFLISYYYFVCILILWLITLASFNYPLAGDIFLLNCGWNSSAFRFRIRLKFILFANDNTELSRELL